jgi:cytochrome-b5 reductase
LSVRATIEGNHVIRPYTPISKPDQEGYFDLLVKKYDSGKLTPYLHSLKVGASVDIRGPVGRYKYKKNSYEHVGLIAGGSGLTPCLQIVRCILESEDYQDDTTRFTLLFQNRTEEDVLLRKELETLQKAHKGRLEVYFHVTNVAGGKSKFGSKPNEASGYIDSTCVHTLMGPAACQHVCICGPSGFNDAMKQLVVDAGHPGTNVFVW